MVKSDMSDDNLPTPWQQPPTPIGYDPSADLTLRRILSGSHREGRRVLLINMPEPQEKAQLARRARAILRALRLWNTEEVVRAISRMLSCFEQYLHETGDDGRAVANKKIAAKWAAELQGVPSWAIERACDAIREGRAEGVSKDFPPSIPRVRDLAESYCAEYRMELDKIGDALRGEPFIEPPSAEERDRVSTKLRTFADALRADVEQQAQAERAPPDSAAMDAQRAEQAHRAFLAEYKALGIEPIMAGGMIISPALLQSLGRLPVKKARQNA